MKTDLLDESSSQVDSQFCSTLITGLRQPSNSQVETADNARLTALVAMLKPATAGAWLIGVLAGETASRESLCRKRGSIRVRHREEGEKAALSLVHASDVPARR